MTVWMFESGFCVYVFPYGQYVITLDVSYRPFPRVFVGRSFALRPTCMFRSSSTACTLEGGRGLLVPLQRASPLASKPGQSHAQLAHHFAQLRTPLSTLGRQHPSKVACQLMRLY